MARKTFTTTIEETLQNEFKASCALNGIQMNTVLELFMKGFSEGKFEVAMNYLIQENKEKKKKKERRI